MDTRIQTNVDGDPPSGETRAPAAYRDDSDFDRLPPEIVWIIASWLDSTADLVRAGATCRRLGATADAIRRERTAARRARGPYVDLIGCAHQLLVAITMDDPSSMVDALDVGHVGLRDDLDLDVIAAHATPVIDVGSTIGATTTYVDRFSCRRTRDDTPLSIAIMYGSARCARALAAMGASLSTRHAIDAVCGLVRDVAWRAITVWHERQDCASKDPLSESIVVRRAGPVDPTAVLAPVFEKGAIAVTTTSARLLLGRTRAALDILARRSLSECDDDAFCKRVLTGVPALINLLVEQGCQPHSPKGLLCLDNTLGLRSTAAHHAQRRLSSDAVQTARIEDHCMSERDTRAAMAEKIAKDIAVLPPDTEAANRALAQHRMGQTILAAYDAVDSAH
ncbi:F-box incomplete domain containing protein [Pandoravirus quercus]|uniref:F-box incomplete domain containing protein n=1 Tax=Pandoravirus quercus TaxID=2107709 RepID=A0A2U7U935_9VIRU|nr:F-box incomplete domain containing protein [Pandoravirus quercus]AVK74954.1 F-box incomplete domain containing protein [Pandoravirus quercus]